MALKKALIISMAVLVGAALLAGPATAGKKKKAPKPYTSADGMVLAPHTLLRASSGQQNSITIQEFENNCGIPVSNSVDAYVYEVPKEYQTIESTITSHAEASAYDLYVLFYDASCKLGPYALEASGTTSPSTNAPTGLMPVNTAYVVIADFLGDPAKVWFELKAGT